MLTYQNSFGARDILSLWFNCIICKSCNLSKVIVSFPRHRSIYWNLKSCIYILCKVDVPKLYGVGDILSLWLQLYNTHCKSCNLYKVIVSLPRHRSILWNVSLESLWLGLVFTRDLRALLKYLFQYRTMISYNLHIVRRLIHEISYHSPND